MANMLEGGGKTPILAPEELQALGFSLVAYPLSLLGVSIRAMERALSGLKAGRVPDVRDMGTFVDIQMAVGFPVSLQVGWVQGDTHTHTLWSARSVHTRVWRVLTQGVERHERTQKDPFSGSAPGGRCGRTAAAWQCVPQKRVVWHHIWGTNHTASFGPSHLSRF